MDQGGFSWTDPDAPSVEPPPSGPTRRQLGMVAAATLVAAAALLAYTVLGGSDGSRLSPVAQAAEKTAGYPGGRMTMTGSVTSSQLSTPVQLSSQSTFDGATGQMRATFSVSGPPPIPTFSVSAVANDESVYLNSPGFPVPDGKTWMKFPADEGGSGENGFSLADPATQLAALKSVSDGIAVVGREQVRGEQTTRYAANLSFDKEADLLRLLGDGENADMLDEAADRAVTDAIPINVWIDDRGLVRRLTFAITVAQDSGGTGSIDMSMDFFAFGLKPKIALPPADQVYEAPPEMIEEFTS